MAFYIYVVCSKSIANFIFSKIISLFMNIYFVHFKVISIRYYALVPTFFQSSKHFKKIIFVILFSSSLDAVFISSIVL